jgi:hypothetical protein
MPLEDLHTIYPRPQDNGLRTDVRWESFTRALGDGLRFDFDPTSDLQVHRYAPSEFKATSHTRDLVRRNRMSVDVGYRPSGLGSHACGPGLDPQHGAAPTSFAFAVTVRCPCGASPA